MTHQFAFGYSRKGQHRRIVFSFVYEKESIILTVSFQLENVPFNIKSYAMITVHVYKQLWLIILLLGIREKVNTGELFSLL